MNDFDEKIISMWKSELLDFKQLYCFIHLQRNAKKRNIPKEFKTEILGDIDYLAESASEDEFQKRWDLTKDNWISKDNEEIKTFTNYFEDQNIKIEIGI